MKRTPLTRKAPIKRTAPVRRSNKRRRLTEWERAYQSVAYVKFVQHQPCAACGRGPCDAAHGETGGMGRKAGWETLMPLCSGLNGCHARQHRVGFSAIGMTAEGRRRAAANTRLAWADYLQSGEPEL